MAEFKIKERFELIKGKDNQGTFNIVPIKQHSLKGYEIDEADLHHLKMLATAYARAKTGKDLVTEYINNVKVVRIPQFPLATFVTMDFIPVINISVMPSQFISDYSSPDIYSLYLNAIALSKFIKNKPFEPEIADQISEYFGQIFMKLFGKKHGLTGSYRDKIPQLQIIIALYVYMGLMGYEKTDDLVRRISNKYYYDGFKLELEKDDISTIQGFLNSLKRNNIMPISINNFATTVVNMASINSLCIFEDISRLMSTLMSCNTSGSNIYSHYWKKVNPKMYDKLLYIAEQNYTRIK